MFYVVQPWDVGSKRAKNATVVSVHDKVDAAYNALDAIAAGLNRDGLAGNVIALLVVDENRQPVPRPGIQ
jgi:hypothetical protein